MGWKGPARVVEGAAPWKATGNKNRHLNTTLSLAGIGSFYALLFGRLLLAGGDPLVLGNCPCLVSALLFMGWVLTNLKKKPGEDSGREWSKAEYKRRIYDGFQDIVSSNVCEVFNE